MKFETPDSPDIKIENERITGWEEFEKFCHFSNPTWSQAASMAASAGITDKQDIQKVTLFLLTKKLEHATKYYRQQIQAGNFSALPL